jgi:hypothetical protein
LESNRIAARTTLVTPNGATCLLDVDRHDLLNVTEDEALDQTRYSALRRWLKGSPQENAWARMVNEAGEAPDLLLDPLEAILATLDAANPPRLASKQRTFRTDLDETNQLNLRVELLIASKLADHGLPFEFGGPGSPDICCATESRRVWLEVTTRSRDDLATLHDEMEAALADVPVTVELRLPERPLRIGAADRKAMCERVRSFAATLPDNEHFPVALPEVDGQAICAALQPIGPSRVYLNLGPELGNHMSDIERELFKVLATKCDQARRNSWESTVILVVDASRLGLSWLRPESVWLRILPTLTIDWTNLPFACLLIAFTSLDSTRLGGACIVSPHTATDQYSAISEVVAALGMPPLRGLGS